MDVHWHVANVTATESYARNGEFGFTVVGGKFMAPNRFLTLDLYRGIAALSVVFFHSSSAEVPFARGFYVAGDFFFVLSGFVLAKRLPSVTESAWVGYRRFLRERILRIWVTLTPALVAMLLIWFGELSLEVKSGIVGQESASSRTLGHFVLAALLLQVFSSAAISWNTPLWSLSAEWIVNVMYAHTRSRPSRLLLAAVAVGTVMLWVGLTSDAAWIELHGPIRGWAGLGRCLAAFSFGVLTFRAFEHDMVKPTGKNLVLATSLGLAMFYLASEDAFGYVAIPLAWIAFSFLVLTSARWESTQARAVSFEWLAEHLGRWSFGIYVWHSPVMVVLAKAASIMGLTLISWASVPYFILTTVMSIFVTSISMRTLEPAIKRNLESRFPVMS